MAFGLPAGVIVLDEPTTGLDVTTQRHVLDTVRSLCRAYGVAAVYISHDLAVVGGLANTVTVMYAGRVVESGTTAAVFGRPLHPYTRGLLRASRRRSVPRSLGDRGPAAAARPARRRGARSPPRCATLPRDCRRRPRPGPR